MKKVTLIVTLLLAANTFFAQSSSTSNGTKGTKGSKDAKPMIDTEVKGKQVPTVVLDRFKADYPNEQPTWSQEGGNYRAVFVDGTKMGGHAVGYDKKGNPMYREMRIDSTAYPAGVSKYFTTQYPGYKYELWSTTDKAGKKRYYSNHNLETLWFDENGNYVSTSKLRN